MTAKEYMKIIRRRYKSSATNIIPLKRIDGKGYYDYINKYPKFKSVFATILDNLDEVPSYYQLTINDHDPKNNASKRLEHEYLLEMIVRWGTSEDSKMVYIKFMLEYKSIPMLDAMPDAETSYQVKVLSCHKPETRYKHWQKNTAK